MLAFNFGDAGLDLILFLASAVGMEDRIRAERCGE